MADSSSTSGSSPRVGSGNSPFVIFTLNQNIQITQFPTPLPDPLDAYRPYYETLADGSLLTSIYQADLFSANSRLFGVGALLTLGAINVWTCVSYIRRGKVKDKTLFWLLLASQILLPTCFGALLSPFFLENVDCTVVNIIAVIATEVSYAILITGILGLKAYRCLSRSRIILFVVWILQLAIFALFAMDIRSINSPRRISGSCSTDGKLRFIPIALMLTVVETLFLALCFLYAVWKSTLYPAAQGRLSIAISEKTPPEADQIDGGRRGWWDYVPRAPTPAAPSNHGHSTQGHTRGQSSTNHGRPSDDSLVKRLRNSVKRLTGSMDLAHHFNAQTSNTYARKPSLPTEQPLSQAPRQLLLQRQSLQSQNQLEKAIASGAGRVSTSTNGHRLSSGKRLSGGRALSEVPPSARTTSVKSISFAPSASNRSSRIDPLQSIPGRPTDDDLTNGGILRSPTSVDTKKIPAILQVRAVIKDEMICASLIMLSCMMAAGVTFWRAKQQDVAFGPSVYLGANWAAISLLVMRTFSQVVRRHEREAILQSPAPFGGHFGPNAATTAMARRRRDALALAATHSSSLISPFPPLDPPGTKGTSRRKLTRRSSWDYASFRRVGEGYTPSLFEDNASLRRREGLRAWDEEKERRRQESQSEQGHSEDVVHQAYHNSRQVHDPNRRPSDPFADFRGIAGSNYDIDGVHGDIGRRKSGESEQGREELMLETDSIHRRSTMLQQPMVASRWAENPFTSATNPFSSDPFLTAGQPTMARRGSISPFASNEPLLPKSTSNRNSGGEPEGFRQPFIGGIIRAGPMVPPRPPPTGRPPSPPTRAIGGGRRGAITDVPGVIPQLGGPASANGVEVHVRVSTSMAVSPPPPEQKRKGPRIAPLTPPPQQNPSPPQSRNGSSIELLENPRFMS